MNIPVGTQNDPHAPWNQKESETCPVCQSSTEFEVYEYYKKIKGHRYRVTEKECHECGFIDSDEPDFDED